MTTRPGPRRPHRLAALPAVAIAAALLAACGSNGTEAGTAAATSPALVAPVTTAAAPTIAPAPTTTVVQATTTAATSAAAPAPAPAPSTTVTLPTPIMPPPEYQAEPEVIVGRLTIPKLDLDTDLYQGITLPTLDKGPGYWPGTAMPGQPGNVVVAGHRTASKRDFRHIDRLEPGDEVVFTVDGVAHRYVVRGHEIVTPDAIRIIEQTPARTATLFSCHPVGSAAERWVVHLELAG